MAFLDIKNVSVRGISACVPKRVEENRDYEFFADGEADRIIESTGIERRHIADTDITSSDLCFKAADKLIDDLKWDRGDIDCLVYISQTPDYILPPTSCILQQKLGLSENCFTVDSSAGCPGWINGMSILSSLLSSGTMRKGLLLVGETPTKYKSREDKSAWPLFGDAGSATALEHDVNTNDIFIYLGTDGGSHDAIIIPDGGFRNPFSQDSLIVKEGDDGMRRNALQSKMDGMSVFTFGIRRGPQSIKALSEHFCINMDEIDYFFIHQANKYMNEKIRKKLKLDPAKMPYSLKDFGNTSCTTIPLTLVVGEKYKDLTKEECNIMACAFGVGLSWGSIYFKSKGLVISNLIYY